MRVAGDCQSGIMETFGEVKELKSRYRSDFATIGDRQGKVQSIIDSALVDVLFFFYFFLDRQKTRHRGGSYPRPV